MNEEELDQNMLRALAKQTSALPREIEPPAGAWEKIRHEIEAGETAPIHSRSKSIWWQRPQLLAAAGLVLVAGSSLATVLVMRERTNERPAITAAGASPTTLQSLAQFTSQENDYIATANRFTEILESQENDLAPETIAKLRESVRVIDAAILEARRALAADPSNKALMEMLMSSYSQKVDLLKRSAQMGQS